MKKLIAIAIVAILFTGASWATEATGTFTLGAKCDFQLNVDEAAIPLGNLFIGQTNDVADVDFVFTLTGNWSAGAETYNVTLSTNFANAGNILDESFLTKTYTVNHDNATTNPATWAAGSANGIKTSGVSPTNPCEGTATFKVLLDKVFVPATQVPGTGYSIIYTVVATQVI